MIPRWYQIEDSLRGSNLLEPAMPQRSSSPNASTADSTGQGLSLNVVGLEAMSTAWTGWTMFCNRKIQRAAMVVGLAAILNCAPYVGVAGAAANPGFTSTYNFDTTLTGVHAFGVTGNGIVVAIFQGTYGPAENVTISVEIQTCGFFGCNWDGATVGGDCTRLLFVGGNSTCNFNTGNSNTLHRIYMIKNFDGNTIKGNVKVS